MVSGKNEELPDFKVKDRIQRSRIFNEESQVREESEVAPWKKADQEAKSRIFGQENEEHGKKGIKERVSDLVDLEWLEKARHEREQEIVNKRGNR